MEKIVITGGLGYVGTELCNLYSGQSRYKEIVVIDNRFVSERVRQLRDWGIDFLHGDILDKKFLKEALSGATTVFHLAGITDVAYTSTESNPEKDKKITAVAVEGTRNIISFVSSECKVIFPSTHVVFEGFGEAKFDITEDEEPSPVLTYAQGKRQSEIDLIESKKDFVIARLASVFGFSLDTMRVGIMPNLFSRITSQNGTIRLFSGGKQYKSIVGLPDVVRALKFLAENPKTSRQIYHISNDKVTVKDVADACKKINNAVTIIKTDDEIPNLGYTISNRKIRELGFEFRCKKENLIKEMIDKWSKKDPDSELEIIQAGQKEFVDTRGKISNYELTEPINLIGLISSKKGTVRANHYHPIQEQKCLLVSGRYISVIKDRSKEGAPVETRIINPGDLAVIKPNVSHTMVFLEDSVFLNLVRGEREHENYGITHTVFHELVDDKFRKELLLNSRTECVIDGSKNLKTILSLGMSPLANNLLDERDQSEELFPLQINFSPKSGNVQLSHAVPREKMFDNYLYVSSTTQVFRDHFNALAKTVIDRFDLNENSHVVDIGSNDGVFLSPLIDQGVRVTGVEPAKNIAEIANSKNIPTICGYFEDKETVDQIDPADVITAFNVFAHSNNLSEITENVKKTLKDEGVFIVEVQYLLNTIEDLTFDNIYHEHYNYWSVTTLKRFFENHGLFLNSVESVNTHGGSIRAYVGKVNNPDNTVNIFLNKEAEAELDNRQNRDIQGVCKKGSKKKRSSSNRVEKNKRCRQENSRIWLTGKSDYRSELLWSQQ